MIASLFVQKNGSRIVATCICGPEWRNPNCDLHGNHAMMCVESAKASSMICPYCDEAMDGETAVNLDGELFCPECAECEMCGRPAVTQRPTFLCEPCKEDFDRAALAPSQTRSSHRGGMMDRNPCPDCGRKPTVRTYPDQTVSCACWRCLHSPPCGAGHTAEEAIADWNEQTARERLTPDGNART